MFANLSSSCGERGDFGSFLSSPTLLVCRIEESGIAGGTALKDDIPVNRNHNSALGYNAGSTVTTGANLRHIGIARHLHRRGSILLADRKGPVEHTTK